MAEHETSEGGERKIPIHHEGEPETAEAKEQGEAHGKSRTRRLVTYLWRHPGVALAGAAGVGALAGISWALPALIGGGVALLLARRSGSEVRSELSRRGSELASRLRTITTHHETGEAHPR